MAATRKIPSDPQTSTDKEARGLLRRAARPFSNKRLTKATGGKLGTKTEGGAQIKGGAV